MSINSNLLLILVQPPRLNQNSSQSRFANIDPDLCFDNLWYDSCRITRCQRYHLRRNGDKLILFDANAYLNRLARKTDIRTTRIPINCEVYINDCCVDPEDYGNPISFNNPNIHICRSLGLHPNTQAPQPFFKRIFQKITEINNIFPLASIGPFGETNKTITSSYKLEELLDFLKLSRKEETTTITILSKEADEQISNLLSVKDIQSTIIWQKMNDGPSSRLNNFINNSMKQKNNFSFTINKKLFESKQKYILSNSTRNNNFINKLLLETSTPIGLPQIQNNTYIIQLANTIIQFHKQLIKIKEYQHFSAADTNDLLVSNGFKHFPKCTFDQLNLESYKNYTIKHLTPIYREYKNLIRYSNPTAPTVIKASQKRTSRETQTSFEEPEPKRRQIEPKESPSIKSSPDKSTPTHTPTNQPRISGITISSKRKDDSLKQITNLTSTSTPIKRTPNKPADKQTAFERFINYLYTQISEEKPLNSIKLKDWRKNNSKETSGLKTQIIEAEIGTKISENSIKTIIEHFYVHLAGDKLMTKFIIDNHKHCQMDETIRKQLSEIDMNKLDTDRRRQLYLQLFADTSDNEEQDNKENNNQLDTSIELI